MAIQLSKGERFNISQAAPDLKKMAIALGWQLTETGQNYEIDVSAFMLGSNGKVPNDKYFIFYNNLQSCDGSLLQSIPAKNNPSQKKQTMYGLTLEKVNPEIEEITFAVTIHEADKINADFSNIANAFIKICNVDTGTELARYKLKENFLRETAVEFGRLYRKNGDWRFQAVGQGYQAGLQSFVDKYCSGNSNNIAPITNELAPEMAADDLQLPAWDLEVESEAAASGETESPPRSQINNQVNSRNRKIPLALAASLGVLVLAAGAGTIAFMRSGNETLKQSKILAVETQNTEKVTDVNLLRSFDGRLKTTIANLEKIPNFPGFGYQQARADLLKLRPSLVAVEQNLQAAESLEKAQKLALEAAVLVQKPPHPIEVWHQSQSKWQQAIGLLEAIESRTPIYNLAQNKLSNYRANRAVIRQRVAIAQKATNFSNQGSLKIQKGDVPGAIANFTQALGLNPNIPQAYLGLGIASSQQGNKQQAIYNYDRALQFNPNLAEAYFGRGQAYYELGNNQQAIGNYQQAIRVNPDYGLAYLERGAIRCMLGTKSQAVADFDRAGELFSKQGDNNNYQLAKNFINECQEPTAQAVICDYRRNIDSLGRRCGGSVNVPIIVRKKPAVSASNSDSSEIKSNSSVEKISPANTDSSSTRTRSRRKSKR
ncbi:TerD family protein [Tychonema sp. LEGE 07203]|uniref:TerD family protein n=1 Tax=Tychonema sp. LEGE 07203 TaxID=1828671 RepID=UPI00187F9531|nr:TerD family protein [Tychonema sp. LEGE 07203]MBE9094584.1 TerD family protein [Tychonema sp. LEGE 07203]